MDAVHFAELRGCRKALERIADALEGATAPIAQDAPAPVGCLHPAESRIDFGVTDGVEDWQCKGCGYRTTAQVEGTPA